MIELKDKNIKMLLSEPDGPCAYYKGVRFDRCGVFRSICCRGRSYADEWFDDHDSYRHDHICGPVEEFGPVARPFGRILKIGVGLLDVCPDASGHAGIDVIGQYDRFRLYPVVESGHRSLSVSDDRAVFTHLMPGEYDYVKTVRLTGDCSFEISHRLCNLGTERLVTDVYNHNFFTLGLQEIGPDRCIDFPFRPAGIWREDSVSAYLTDSGIRFSRRIEPGEKAFMGDLHDAGRGSIMSVADGNMPDADVVISSMNGHMPGMNRYMPDMNDSMSGAECPASGIQAYDGRKNGYSFSLSGNSMRVEVRCDAPMDHAVFWSNHRVSCVEPYIKIGIAPGHDYRWTITWRCL